MLTFLTVATRPERGTRALLASARRAGFQPVVLGAGMTWTGTIMKLALLRDALWERRKAGGTVLFADAFDSLVLHGADVIVEKFRAFDHPLLFSAEKNCWPDAWKAAEYPSSPTPWRYLNSGGFIGTVGALLDLLPPPDEPLAGTRDQRWWTDFFLATDGDIRLDVRCEIFQSLWGADGDIEWGKEVRNRITATSPSVLHGNGGVDMSRALAWCREHGCLGD